MQDDRSIEYVFGRYRIRSDERILRADGRRIALTPKVADTLVAFVQTPDRIISKSDLMDRIWPDGFVDEANLTQNVYMLRKVFAEFGSDVRIENVPKRGYRIVVPAGVDAGVGVAAGIVRTVDAERRPLRRYFVPFALACVLLLGTGGPATAPVAPWRGSPYRLPPAALQAYLLGRYYLNRGTAVDLHRSIACFTRLIRERPESALGYAGLADGLTSLTFRIADPVERTRQSARAIALATQAVATDGDSADAHAALGATEATLEHDDVAAARSFETALRLDPANLDALVWYGTERMNQGRLAEARLLFERAMSADPGSAGAIASLAWADFLARNFGEAIAYSEQLLRGHRLESIARITLANSLVEKGDFARALPGGRGVTSLP